MEIRLELAAFAAAVISGVVSFVVAWLTASRTLQTEIAKLQLAAETGAFARLVDARLASYPALYTLLSDLVKSLEAESLEPTSLRTLLTKVDDWDSKFALLLGPKTANTCWQFRTHLRQAIMHLQTPGPADGRGKILDDIFHNASDLELALRSDLGVYGLSGDVPAARLRPRVPPSYLEGAT
jgi:hypothetical protein